MDILAKSGRRRCSLRSSAYCLAHLPGGRSSTTLGRMYCVRRCEGYLKPHRSLPCGAPVRLAPQRALYYGLCEGQNIFRTSPEIPGLRDSVEGFGIPGQHGEVHAEEAAHLEETHVAQQAQALCMRLQVTARPPRSATASRRTRG